MTATATELRFASGGPDDGPAAEQARRLGDVASYLLTGVPYLYTRGSYGNETVMHFGVPRGYGSPKLGNRTRGSHVLSLRGSAWLLRSGTRPAFVGCGQLAPVGPGVVPLGAEPIDGTALESGAFVAPDARVIRVTPFPVSVPTPGFGLELVLSDGSAVFVLPIPAETDPPADTPEIADWELLTPSGFLQAGPGQTWTYEPVGS